MKIVINTCYGGFSLSKEAGKWLLNNGIEEPFKSKIQRRINEMGGSNFILADLEEHSNRTHPLLVKCVETLGKRASGEYAKLEIEEVSGDYYRIDEYDGIESVITPELDYFLENKYK